MRKIILILAVLSILLCIIGCSDDKKSSITGVDFNDPSYLENIDFFLGSLTKEFGTFLTLLSRNEVFQVN